MRTATYFASECGTCGRSLRIRIAYLGKMLACPHCSARFIASDPQLAATQGTRSDRILKHADLLLKLADESLDQPNPAHRECSSVSTTY